MSRFYDIEIEPADARQRFAQGEKVYVQCQACRREELHTVTGFTSDGFLAVHDGILELEKSPNHPTRYLVTRFFRKELA